MISSRVGEPVKGRFGFWMAALLTAVSSVLLIVAFHPVDAGFVCWFALVPWLTMLAFSRMRCALFLTFLMGFCFFFFGVQWIRHVGDTLMGLLLVAAIMGGLILLAGWLIKLIAWGGPKIPMALVVPVVWVSLEYLRSILFTGFPWLFLAHTQHSYLPVIQISDITGAWGVSLQIAMVNGLLADLIIRMRIKPRGKPLFDLRAAATTTVVVLLVSASIGYGYFRLSTLRFFEGPKLLLVQGNWPMDQKKRGRETETIYEKLKRLSEAGLQANPDTDMVVWSETMAPVRYINTPNMERERALYRMRMPDRLDIEKLLDRRVDFNHDVLSWMQAFSARTGTFLLFGSETGYGPLSPLRADPMIPDAITPIDLVQHNSVYCFAPGQVYAEGIHIPGKRYPEIELTPAAVYHKVHLVPVGEYVPLAAFPMIQRAFAKLIYATGAFASDLEPGKTAVQQFGVISRADGKTYRFGNAICFENAFGDLNRQTVCQANTKVVDFIVNESNDAWFLSSAQLDQTVAISVFRAIENRIGYVRCANTGISLFIAPDGSYSNDDVLQHANGNRKEVEGSLARRVKICPDLTLYSRYGDVILIPLLLLLLALVAYTLRPKEFIAAVG